MLALSTGAVELRAQSGTSNQLWVNLTFDWPMSERLLLELDLEPKWQVSGSGDPWGTLDGTGLVEYYPNHWLDLTGEQIVGFTRQNED